MSTVRGYLDNHLRPVSAVMSCLEEQGIRPTKSVRSQIREHIRHGVLPIDLCLEVLGLKDDGKFHNMTFSCDRAKNQTTIRIDKHPPIIV